MKSYNNRAHRPGISAIQAIENGEIDIATGGNDGLVKLWNIEKGTCL